ncbi:nucleotide sugar dehydrogenase [Thermodesulfatator indicus DSM 15286]|uniref:UDP-glucose 6-dehydrogenase n=1 Tax=Thermodesulfatator indicus (strain DSM 15286 / JCM 11887 / CIR29812) TaxID=667014 RepID=F8A8J2_THEID|nr:UDP-glucose/GDP-mannose dehydrogenase family protein [Thermodesulfatator indicus]AEH45078.1 nucleotide sugar dehydrogenase [Thermodesulfatator indicus DSM 15286]
MHIAVIGTGYVGLVSGAGMADFGMNVVCVDIDEEKITKLKAGEIPFYEPGLKELVAKNVKAGRLSFTTDLAEAVKRTLVIFICVGTPPAPDGSADLSAVKSVALSLAETIDEYKVIVTKSTVPVGTNRWIKQLIDENKKNDVKVDVISNPEFLREGCAIEDFMRPDRVVIGGESDHAIAIIKDIYRPLYLAETPFVITDLETAEMIKYASNAFLATKISFINEVATLCDKVGADVITVAKAMGLDPRIGPRFLNPGPGFGGSCFPKDVRALAYLGKQNNHPMHILEAVLTVNERQREVTVQKVKQICGDLPGKTIAVLGLAFKPNTSDVRESPALDIVERLIAEGAKVQAYDPIAEEEFKKAKPELPVKYATDPYEAADGAHCLLILTEWNEFRYLDLEKIKNLMAEPAIVDARNIYEPARMQKLGFKYTGMGRGNFAGQKA